MTASENRAMRRTRCVCCARFPAAAHTVCTGVSVRRGAQEERFAVSTRVFFRPMTDDEIRAYIKTGEPMDKAGAYGVQSRGALFVERIDGDFFNVMGLPVEQLGLVLARFGVKLL